MFARRPTLSTGFTLLEVLLTLSLSVVFAALVGGALQFYARDMNVRDMDIRQTQLASAVMQMIEDDLRATLHSEPVDTSALESLLQATASATAGESSDDASSSDQDLSAAGIDSEDTTALPPDTSSMNLQSGAAMLETPGLIGNQFQIQVDLSQLPRLEEYVVMLDDSASNIDDVPSDIKTVAYYVQDAGMLGGVQDALEAIDPASNAGATGGLVRRSLDRAATMYATETGNLASLNQSAEVLAPEVVGIEFSYWDGVTWLLEWSSDEYGELPLAVRIQLYMVASGVDPTDVSITSDSESLRTFTHVVRLPMAQPIQLEDDISGTAL